MALLCGWASIDENGRAHGGKAGDQTGREVRTGGWYNFNQNVVLRFKDRNLAKRYANVIKGICGNDLVGYDQWQRTTLYDHLKASNWNPAQITVACETDCSAMVGAALNAVGIHVSKDIYTGNMVNACMNTGYFIKLTGSKYLASDSYLLTGDIIVNEAHHVISALADGYKSGSQTVVIPVKAHVKPEYAKYFSRAVAGSYRVTATSLNMRTNASTSKPIITVIPNGKVVNCYGYYNKDSAGVNWLYVQYGGVTGYCCSTWLTK